jgi:hypothetical protein
MSQSVITLPVRNFKFLTEGSLKEGENYRFCEKTCLPSETGFRSVFLDGGTNGYQLADEPSSTDLIGFALATAKYAQGRAMGEAKRAHICGREPASQRPGYTG